MNNKFWREVFDQVMSLVLIYRVDPAGPQLMFVNSVVTSVLGYTAEAFVMESEQSGKLRSQLDEVFRAASQGDPIVQLTDLGGSEKKFNLGVSSFVSDSIKSDLVVVTLQNLDSASSVSTEFSSEVVAESLVMGSIIERLNHVATANGNMIFVGEAGTGKRMLMGQLLPDAVRAGHSIWILDYESPKAQFLSDGVQVDVDTLFAQRIKKPVTLCVYEFQSMPVVDQQRLLKWLDSNDQDKRFIVGSQVSADELVSRGTLDAALYYKLNLISIVLPPLTMRRSDIRPYTELWFRRARNAMGIEKPEISDKEWDRLFHFAYSGNFDELNQILIRSLAAYKDVFTFMVDEPKAKKQIEKRVEQSKMVNGLSIQMPFDDYMREYLSAVLETCDGKIYGDDGAAAVLGMKPTTLQSKMQKYGVRRVES